MTTNSSKLLAEMNGTPELKPNQHIKSKNLPMTTVNDKLSEDMFKQKQMLKDESDAKYQQNVSDQDSTITSPK